MRELFLKPVVIFGHPRDPGSPFNPPLKKTEFNFDFLNFNHVNDPKSTPTEKKGESIKSIYVRRGRKMGLTCGGKGGMMEMHNIYPCTCVIWIQEWIRIDKSRGQ